MSNSFCGAFAALLIPTTRAVFRTSEVLGQGLRWFNCRLVSRSMARRRVAVGASMLAMCSGACVSKCDPFGVFFGTHGDLHAGDAGDSRACGRWASRLD